MALIYDRFPDSICYLYSSQEDAELGDNLGGTGFFIYRVSPKTGRHYHFAVTNAHVINDGFPVIKVNRMDGKDPDIIQFTSENWVPHGGGADVAVAYLADASGLSCEAVNAFHILTPQFVLQGQPKLGDEVYMLGRFGGSPGRKHNRPVARSGIVSQLPDPDEPIAYDKTIEPQEAFLMEMHSISGFSGSPVFHNVDVVVNAAKMRPILETFYNLFPEGQYSFEDGSSPIWLVGIDAGGFSSWNETRMRDEHGKMMRTHYQVKSPSGFSVVIPAWKIGELLMQKELMDPVNEDDKKAEEAGIVAESHSSKADKGNFNRELFENALKQASQKLSEPESETKKT